MEIEILTGHGHSGERISIRSRNKLHKDANGKDSEDKIRLLTHPVPSKLASHEQLPDGSHVHVIDVQLEHWQGSTESLRLTIRDRLITQGLGDCDSEPFANCASEAVAELMSLNDTTRLYEWEDIWRKDTLGLTEQIDSTKDAGILNDEHPHRHYTRLRHNVSRRMDLLAWINLYREHGRAPALRWGRDMELI